MRRPVSRCAAVVLGGFLLFECDAFEPEDAMSPPALDGGARDGPESVAPVVDGGGADGPAADAGPLDAARDGGPVCHAPPTHPCFTMGTCSVVWGPVGAPNPDGLTMLYPHDPVLRAEHVYFSVQSNDVAGRNRSGPGYIYRLDAPSMTNLQRLTPLQQKPSFATTDGDYLYWRAEAPTAGTWEVRRIDLRDACNGPGGGNCSVETVARLPRTIVRTVAVSPIELYIQLDDAEVRHVVFEQGGWQQPMPLADLSGYRTALVAGRPPLWASRPVDGGTSLYALGGAERFTALASWKSAEPTILATSCGRTFLFDYRIVPPFYRVLPGGLTPLACVGCEANLVFDHVVDAKFAYVAAPNAGWLRAVPLAGGTAVTLATGDIWNVIEDDTAVFFTDVNGGRLGRIAKH